MSEKYKSYNKKSEYSYTFGVFPTIELLLKKPEAASNIFLSSEGKGNEGIDKIIGICSTKGIYCSYNDKLIARLSPKENCYALGVFNKYASKLQTNSSHIVIDNPGNAGNLGTIIRTMAGFGVESLGIIRPGVDVFDPKTVRASMGSIFHISFQYFDSIEEYMSSYNNNIYPFMLKAKKTLHDIKNERAEKFCLVFGNESSGLPDRYNDIGISLTIPHSSVIDSLNLSIAVGIALYEFTKPGYGK
ncbi:MAG: TrmH family RNA methyltransferase [Bacillota bacterium]